MSNGRVDVESFAGDALLPSGIEVFKSAHIVQAVGKLDEHDANVGHHGQQHLADIFGLAGFGRADVQAGDFSDAFDEVGDVRAEAFFNAGGGILGVLDGVMQDGGGERGDIEPHVSKNVRHFEEMGHIRLAGTAELIVMALRSNFIGAAEHPGILGRAVLTEFFEEFFESRVQQASRAVAVEAQREIARRGHGLVYAQTGASGEGVKERRVTSDECGVPEWELLVHTPAVFVRVANKGVGVYGTWKCVWRMEDGSATEGRRPGADEEEGGLFLTLGYP